MNTDGLRVVKPCHNPIRKCALCLRFVGIGVGRIELLTRIDRKIITDWLKAEGVYQRLPRSGAKVGTYWYGPSRAKPKPPLIRKPKLSVEEKKQRHRENAKRQWLKNKHDPDWIAKRVAQHRAWKKRNLEYCKEYDAHHRERNKEWYREWARRDRKKPERKIVHNLRRRLRDIVHECDSLSSRSLIGCSPKFLHEWIAGQFKRGMTWENYGTKWHIDHIIPCAAFNLADSNQARMCFHYTNLRPLFTDANMKKRDSIPVGHQPELAMPL